MPDQVDPTEVFALGLDREDPLGNFRERFHLIPETVNIRARPSNVSRIRPSPLYGTYHEIWKTVAHLKAIIGGWNQGASPTPNSLP